MTRIRQMLMVLRTRRARRLGNVDSVSFDAFCNENASDLYPVTKESSLSVKESPVNNGLKYTRYSSYPTKTLSNCSRPSLVMVIVLLMIVAVFIILPTIYLMHCFGMIQVDRDTHISHSFALKDKEHYTPSQKVHEALDLNSNVNKSLSPPPKPDYKRCKLENKLKFDCYPSNKPSKEKCEARGCCWVPIIKGRNKEINVPYCFYPSDYESYSYVNSTVTDFGSIAFLSRKYQSPYPDNVDLIKIIVKHETENRLHFKILDPNQNRYEPSYPSVPIVDKAPAELLYKFVYGNSTGFQVIRKSDNVVLFDAMSLQSMVFADQFLQISSKLPSDKIYGLGEHRSSLLLPSNWKTYTLFNHDAVPTENMNLYGSHPFYLNIEPSGNSHGVFLLNSNAMDIILQPAPAITFRAIGGIFDFYVMLGPSPAEVIRQYTEIIGRPHMPPYWGLGFHLCRFGYNTLNETRKVMQRTIDAGIPLDTQWNDLDYMNNSNDFTYDRVNYRGLPNFVKELHSKGMHYIPLIDSGVSASEKKGAYPPFDQGIAMDIFIKNSSGQPFVGKVWNKATTVWPDFTKTNSVDYWTLMLRSLHDSIPFDGAWIDMNEPSNFLSGSFDGCPKSKYDSPPYLPAIDGGIINYKTVCMSANHSGGLHYNVHNLYGFLEAIVTNFALAEIRGKRPMIISRSTFPGHGKFAGHWSGDVYSKWVDMKFSIPQLLSFSLFGVPLMGADICGFNGNTTAALCNRWMQLGAFYPFSRNHNTDDGIEQDPVALGLDVVLSAKKALSIRYSLLPYLYTLFWAAHVQGDTVARPLFFEFTSDFNTHNIDDQFMWGSALMIIPVLEENVIYVKPYIPKGVWYNYYTYDKIIEDKGSHLTLSAPLDTIPLLIRGGSIIPKQNPANTTTESRKSKCTLLAAGDLNGEATGELYWDDGDSLNSVEEWKYSLIKFFMKKGIMTSEVIHWGPENPPNLDVIYILGIEPVKTVTVNDRIVPAIYDEAHKFLLIENIDVSFQEVLKVVWE